MKKIHLLGYLNKFHPRPIEVEAESVSEALTALKHIKGIDTETMAKRVVRVRGFESQDALNAKTDVKDIYVVPTMRGAGGKGGFFQIIVGVILVVVGAMTSWVGGGALIASGISMIAGGILAMLAPTPKISSNDTDGRSSLFIPATQNTVKIGTRKPILYGRIKHFGHYLSFNVDAKRYDETPLNIAGYCNSTGSGQDNLCVIY